MKDDADREALLHSWDDQTYTLDYQKADGSMPFDRMVNVAVGSVPRDTQTAFLRYEFATKQFASHYFGPGIQLATMTVHHEPRTRDFVPFEVVYCWVEHRPSGSVERQHAELITSPLHEYTINVGGWRDPTMKWVRLNLQDQGPDGDRQDYGYADGQDVGAGRNRPGCVSLG